MARLTERLLWSLGLLSGKSSLRVEARVLAIQGQTIAIEGLSGLASVGDRIDLHAKGEAAIKAEIIGFNGRVSQATAYCNVSGLGPGSYAATSFPVLPTGLAVDRLWLGRIIDPLGHALDRREPLPHGSRILMRHQNAPPAAARARLGPRIDLGVTAINLFATCRRGQRLGIFAGPGIGKSMLMGLLAKNTTCDVIIVALIGERGREVREFIEENMCDAVRQKSILIIATSDSSPIMRRESAISAMTIAEYFRDTGKHVLLIMDSITRYCQALREIALACGELPIKGGYPASVLADLPRLLERAGPGYDDEGGVGYITGIFSVLVEGDDINEPLADSIRGYLDGHIVLDRKIAERGRYPAVDVLRSLSRAIVGCNTSIESENITRARSILSMHENMRDLIGLGAYRAGSDPQVDRAIELAPQIDRLLHQSGCDPMGIGKEFEELDKILSKYFS